MFDRVFFWVTQKLNFFVALHYYYLKEAVITVCLLNYNTLTSIACKRTKIYPGPVGTVAFEILHQAREDGFTTVISSCSTIT